MMIWEGLGFGERFGRYRPPATPGSPNAPGYLGLDFYW
jgi:hypothetical protein